MMSLYILSTLYGIAGLCYLFITIRRIVKQNGIRVFDFSRLMYSVIYGFIPMLLYTKEAVGERNLFFTAYDNTQLWECYLLFFFSVVIFCVLNLSYKCIKIKAPEQALRRYDGVDVKYNMNGRLLLISGVVALAIGWISLLLWTRAYGSLNNFILNANAIRSGRGEISNSFAFMKQFVRIMSVALFAIYSSYLHIRPRGIKKVIFLAIILIALVGNYYYTLASDSRASIMFLGIALVAISLRHRKKEKISRYLINSAFLVILFLLITIYADTFTRYIRFGIWESSNTNFLDALIREFSFTLCSEMKAIQGWIRGDLNVKIVDDLINSITSWIPDRFIPFDTPETIWTYNTNFYGRMGAGTSPCDLVATSIYETGIIGIIIHPFVLGQLIGRIDKSLWRTEASAYMDVYYGVFAHVFVMQISHNQYSTIVLGLFPAFLFFLITKVVNQLFDRKS